MVFFPDTNPMKVASVEIHIHQHRNRHKNTGYCLCYPFQDSAEVVRVGALIIQTTGDAGICHEKSDGPGAKQFGASCLIVLCVFCLVYYCLLRFTNNDFFWP